MEFSSLPYDALLRILQHLDSDKLYTLGLLCRRLNLIAFDVIIRRHQYYWGIPSTSFRLSLPEDLLIISVLRHSFFSPFPSSLKRLDLQLNHGPEDATALANDFRQFIGLLMMKPTMPFHMVLRPVETVTIRTKIDVHIDSEALFKALLHTCKSCRTVTISKSIDVYSYFHRTPYPRYRDTTRYEKVLEKPPPKSEKPYYWKDRLKQPKFTPGGVSILGSLYLTFVNSIPAMNELSNAPEVTLPSTPRLWGAAWSGILSGLTSSVSLKGLTIDPTGIAPCDFVEFLAQLPKLETLTVHQDSSTVNGTYDLWQTQEIIIEKPSTFRSLRFLYLPLPHAAVILGQRLPQLSNVEINARGGTLFTQWSQKTFTKLASHIKALKRTVKTRLKVEFSHRPGNVVEMVRDLDGYFQSSLSNSKKDQYPLSAFTDVTMDKMKTLHVSRDHDFFVQTLIQWLRLFPALLHARFSAYYPTSHVHRMYPLIRAIHTQCPGIRLVSISYRTSVVSDVLSEHEKNYIRRRSSGTTTFGDLDLDILYQIQQYLDVHELYPLSRLCRNLRNWVLPLYLRKRGFPEPSTGNIMFHLQEKHTETLTDISALTLSSPEKIHHLLIRIDVNISLFLLFEFLHRTLRLVQKCTTLGAVSLRLGGPPSRAVDAQISERSSNLWTELVCNVLCALAERSKSLTINGQGILGSLVLARRGHTLHGGCLQSMAQSPLKHKLSMLELDFESLRLPAISDYMIPRLRKSETVTHVNIIGATSLVFSTLQSIVSAFPMITHLKLSGSDILPEDVLSALCSLTYLQDLQLSGCRSYCDMKQGRLRPIEVKGLVPNLAALQNLSASKEYIDFLLDNGDGLPKLGHVIIEFHYDHPIFPPRINPIEILQSLPGTVHRLKAHPNNPSLGLDIIISTITDLFPDQMTDTGWALIARSTTTMILRQFARTSQLDDWKTLTETAQSLTSWLKLFPALRTLHFTNIGDLRGLDLVLEDPLLIEVCRGLHAIFVNGSLSNHATT